MSQHFVITVFCSDGGVCGAVFLRKEYYAPVTESRQDFPDGLFQIEHIIR